MALGGDVRDAPHLPHPAPDRCLRQWRISVSPGCRIAARCFAFPTGFGLGRSATVTELTKRRWRQFSIARESIDVSPDRRRPRSLGVAGQTEATVSRICRYRSMPCTTGAAVRTYNIPFG